MAPADSISSALCEFDRLGQDGDGYLSRPEFAALRTRFWTSDDPREPGNLMCGELPRV
ncbi:hypothetical protein ACGFZQ_15255 [Streptomyces sp. NPDC048254]|uniref:hypothetical protein n=1 Tax=Streptomyces sp. NPDC048254 TaxID=3365525 RepID=UPI00371DE62E